jgi:hypothetical protein
MVAMPQRDVGGDTRLNGRAIFGVGHQHAGDTALAEIPHAAADGEDLFARRRRTCPGRECREAELPAVPVSFRPALGSMIRRVWTAVCMVRRRHCRETHQAESLHEERTLLAEEHREALVDEQLERVAFDLLKSGLIGGIQRRGRRDAVLEAGADVLGVIR